MANKLKNEGLLPKGTCNDNLQWEFNNGKLVIYGFGDLDDLCFQGCSSIRSIIIQGGVTSIGDGVFFHCRNLTSVRITSSLSEIGNETFENCDSLISITFPYCLKSIGFRAFEHCCSLINADIPNSVTCIGEDAFKDVCNIEYHGHADWRVPWGARCLNGYVEGDLVYRDQTKTTLCACIRAAKGKIVIPNSVTSIGDNAFSGCESLTSVIIPNSVTSIGYRAFDEVPNIEYRGPADGAPWGAKRLNGIEY